jgi:hypothetical protein
MYLVVENRTKRVLWETRELTQALAFAQGRVAADVVRAHDKLHWTVGLTTIEQNKSLAKAKDLSDAERDYHATMYY